jgi:acyl dehydratase
MDGRRYEALTNIILPTYSGLVSYGFAARMVIKHFCDNKASNLESLSVRFSSPVFPGETLVTKMWNEGGTVIIEMTVKERNKVTLTNAFAKVKNSKSLKRVPTAGL